MDIDTAVETYLRLLPELETKQKEMKALRNVERKCKAAFKKHVKQHGPLHVGGKTFQFEQKEKVVLTMDRLEEQMPAREVQAYIQNNTEQVEVFKAA